MRRLIIGLFGCLLVAGLLGTSSISAVAADTPIDGPTKQELKDKLKEKGSFNVLVEAKEGSVISFEHGMDDQDLVEIKSDKDVDDLYADPNVSVVVDSDATLMPAGELGDASLAPAATIGSPLGNTGSGYAIAIIDVGFDESNADYSSRIIAKHCSIGTNSCPNGSTTQDGSGAASNAYCSGATSCDHGTWMAKIAAGNPTGTSEDGIATGASLILIRSGVVNGSNEAVANTTGVINALDWLHDQIQASAFGVPVVAVSMSLSDGGNNASNCDSSFSGTFYNNIQELRDDVDVVSVIATGNAGNRNGIGVPGCMSNSLSVTGTASGNIAANASVNAFTDTAAAYSQRINISGTPTDINGTSSATAAVAGGVATIANALGGLNYTVSQLENAIRFTGTNIADLRSSGMWSVNEMGATPAEQHLYELNNINTGRVNLWHQFRVLDTRTGFGEDCCTSITPLGAGSYNMNMAAKIGVPASSVSAVLLNVTAVSPSASTYITLGPGTVSSPNYSNLNLAASQAPTAVAVWVPMDANGVVGVYNDSGSVHLIVDVLGFVPTSTDTNIVTPTRVIDTRSGSPIGGGVYRDFDLRSVGPIPSNATGVYGNLTVINNITGSANTYVSAKSAGSGVPATSNVNPANGEIRNGFAVVKFAANGHMEIYNDSGNIHVLFDVVGYTTSGDTDVAPVDGARALDTRPNHMANNTEFTFGGTGVCGAGGVVPNATLISGNNGSFLSLYPGTQGFSNTSTANADNGQLKSNASAVPQGTTQNNTQIYPLAKGWKYFNYGPNGTNDALFDIMACLGS